MTLNAEERKVWQHRYAPDTVVEYEPSPYRLWQAYRALEQQLAKAQARAALWKRWAKTAWIYRGLSEILHMLRQRDVAREERDVALARADAAEAKLDRVRELREQVPLWENATEWLEALDAALEDTDG